MGFEVEHEFVGAADVYRCFKDSFRPPILDGGDVSFGGYAGIFFRRRPLDVNEDFHLVLADRRLCRSQRSPSLMSNPLPTICFSTCMCRGTLRKLFPLATRTSRIRSG